MTHDIAALVARLRLRARALRATTTTLPAIDEETGNLLNAAAAALVARLRMIADCYQTAGCEGPDEATIREAAAALEAMQADIERLRASGVDGAASSQDARSESERR